MHFERGRLFENAVYISCWWGEYGSICTIELAPDGTVEVVSCGGRFRSGAIFSGLRLGVSAERLLQLASFRTDTDRALPPAWNASSQMTPLRIARLPQ